MENIERLHPRAFTKFCMSIGMVPSSYTSALTYEEQLLWFCSYLEKNVIPAVNNNAEALEEVQNLMVQLQDYVNNYFDNLDVQEEINNKLDDMAEQGQLTDIIAQYLQLAGVLAYDNKAAMKSAQNLVNGSIAKTLGDETFQDGYGFFYKIRQVKNTDVIDDELIIQLYDPNLVAERIPEPQLGHLENLTTNDKSTLVKAINNTPNSQTLVLGKSITYDIPSTDDIAHMQGAFANGNYLYVCVQGGTNSPDGYVYVFNIVNNTFVEKITIDDLYHASDGTYLNDKFYIATGEANKIVEYDVTNATSQTLQPFTGTDYENLIVGSVSQLNGKLVVWLVPTTYATEKSLDNYKFVTINSDNSISEIQYEDPYKIASFIDGYVTPQNCDIDGENNLVYILLQNPNIIVEASIADNKITVQKAYNLPFQDQYRNPIGESESVAVINNTSYPKGSLFFTSRIFQTKENTTIEYNNDVIQNYLINPKASVTNFASSTEGYGIGGLNHFSHTTVKKTSDDLIETGSTEHPVKDLIRALNQVKFTNGGGEIRIRDNNNYYLPFLFGYNNIRIVAENGYTPTIYIGDITNCVLNFETLGTGKITIKPINDNKRITIKQSYINLNAGSANCIEFQDCQVLLSQTRLSSRRCAFTNTATVSSGYCFQVFDASEIIDQFAFTTTGDKYIQYGNGSIVATGVTGSNINKQGQGVLLTIS